MTVRKIEHFQSWLISNRFSKNSRENADVDRRTFFQILDRRKRIEKHLKENQPKKKQK